ncbi:hypothetical protein FHR99_003237 [Litorivivens lipolytica]|uniref:Uncharacterized protein n=1 Tax=Litorivivens lipolytica TaxID=1524264 RepID=A0A7W4Z766_9GAMM|nr:hypothetical protein [Litorivivens lipolytica]MBB3048963.1 hypothetical protein [Litorivivens lipolytica]
MYKTGADTSQQRRGHAYQWLWRYGVIALYVSLIQPATANPAQQDPQLHADKHTNYLSPIEREKQGPQTRPPGSLSDSELNRISMELCSGSYTFEEFVTLMEEHGILRNYHRHWPQFYCDKQAQYHFLHLLIDNYDSSMRYINGLLTSLRIVAASDNLAELLNIPDREGYTALDMIDFFMEDTSEDDYLKLESLRKSLAFFGAKNSPEP